MEPRITAAEAALLGVLPPRSPREMSIAAIVAEARRERDRALAEGIKRAFRGLRAFLTAMRSRRETIERLRALDDRQLYDVGVLRGNIPAAANDLVEPRRAA